MKIKRSIFFSVVLAFSVVTAGPAAWAGRGCNSPTGADPAGFIDTDKTAPGTKYDVTLTIYYAEPPTCPFIPGPDDRYTDMHLFMRLEGNTDTGGGFGNLSGGNINSGTELFGYGGVVECIPYNDADLTTQEEIAIQQAALEEFFYFVVNPHIYELKNPEDPDGCDPTLADPLNNPCPAIALKSFDKLVEDGGGSLSGGLLFTIMDIVIAIDD